MLRLSLESVVLKVMSLPLETVTDGAVSGESDEDEDGRVASYRLGAREVLARCLQPPAVQAVDAAVKALFMSGAIDACNDVAEVTSCGRVMSSMPCDSRVTSMVLAGCMLGCVAADPPLVLYRVTIVRPHTVLCQQTGWRCRSPRCNGHVAQCVRVRPPRHDGQQSRVRPCVCCVMCYVAPSRT